MTNTLIIGGGIAGFTLAKELRTLGHSGSIGIIDPEGLPYDRPPLSKEILNGAKTPEQLLLAAEEFYRDNSIDIIEQRARRIDVDSNTVELDNGEALSYDNLVIATGGIPRQLPTPGFDDPNLIVLRTLNDAHTLKNALTPGTRLAIIGAGLIGAEVASSAKELGAQVTLIDPQAVSLIPAVGEDLAHRLHNLHDANDVTFICGMTTAITRNGDHYTITIDGHDPVDADHVLLAVGIVAESELAHSAGLDFDNGILVDHSQRTTQPNIWAIGDCARHRNPNGSLERRHEHWESAIFDAQTAAASITGSDLPQHGCSWFWTDRYNVHVEGAGDMSAPGTTVIRPNADGEPEVAFRLAEDGRMVGCAAIDAGMAVRVARRIIDRGIIVDPQQLADPGVNLKKLAR
ncbi:MAG: FAD-dependent oxidoreductase [Corynebacterium sp.]|uniref:NAD(P)/FAD-dependent oxidoreductase n=1 Tax=Corynebacterium sp. TaxID=1720 RepID=UPI0026DAA226|nr:FAD-dependent oxidoreductase [Corynebacterium sp.]MDO4761625.1 FAD-dependent oxidoreductase [Corynebacterium sp.]